MIKSEKGREGQSEGEMEIEEEKGREETRLVPYTTSREPEANKM